MGIIKNLFRAFGGRNTRTSRTEGPRKLWANRCRPVVEHLEDRITPATFYVDPTPGMGGTQFTPNGGDHTAVGALTPGVNIFATIQAAVNAAAANGTGPDIIKVADGTYNELVQISEANLTLQGNKYL